jgi:Flp pilus assembly protein TadG
MSDRRTRSNFLLGRGRAWLAGLVGDQRAIAATEFALIFPFLILLYLGSSQLIEGILLDRQVTLTADTVANIVAQYTSISASNQMPDILNASVQIFSPNPSAPAKIVVTCITIDNSGKATVVWSQTLNGTARSVGSVVPVPAAMDVPNTTLILSEATYAYTPQFDFIHMGTFNLYASIYMAPRASSVINLVS